MPPELRRVIAVTVVVGSLLLAPCADAQLGGGDAASERISVFGQVVDAGSGEPIADAIVAFTAVGPRSSTRRPSPVAIRGETLTNDSGAFTVAASSAQSMRLTAAAEGYIPGAYGQRWPAGPDEAVRVSSARRDVVIRLWKYASLSGTVVRQDGTPVDGVRVDAIPVSAFAGTIESTRTDSDGRYLIDALPPGTYYAAVTAVHTTVPRRIAERLEQGGAAATALRVELARSDASIPESRGIPSGSWELHAPDGLAPPDSIGRLVYRTRFYPAATSIAGASPIRLHAGENRQQVDFHLDVVPAARVSGVLLSPAGPVANVGVRLLAAGSDAGLSSEPGVIASTVSDAAGQFTFLGVPAGSYELRAMQQPGGPPAGPLPPHIPGSFANDTRSLLWGSTPVLVDHTSVDGLQVHLAPGPVVTGRVDVTAGDRRIGSALPPTLILQPTDRRRASVHIAVAADGTFRASAVAPGDYVVALPDGGEWALSSAEYGARDVSQEAISLTRGEYFIAVKSTDRQSSLIVRVDAQNDTVPLFIFPARRSRGSPQASFRHVTATGPELQVRQVLPPGTYAVVAAAEGVFDIDWREPEIIELLDRVATRVTVGEGETAEVRVQAVELR